MPRGKPREGGVRPSTRFQELGCYVAHVVPYVDAEVAAALKELQHVSPFDFSALRVEDLPSLRGDGPTSGEEPSPGVDRHDHLVEGNAEADIVLRMYRPSGAGEPRPCLYWIHGGGYVLGRYTMDDARLDQWCCTFGCVVVSVDYRLAPEHPYPAPLDDCYAGLRWAYAAADDYGIDRTKFGIGGVSAGGGLAAALALLARDRAEVMLAFQLLVYPMIDDRQLTPSSSWEVPVWPPSANRFGWRCYLGDRYGGDVPAYAAAARADDLTGLPPTLVMVGSADGFVDENINYAQRLNQAGVPTELLVYAGGPHGFDLLAPESQLARRAGRSVDAWLGATVGYPAYSAANSAANGVPPVC